MALVVPLPSWSWLSFHPHPPSSPGRSGCLLCPLHCALLPPSLCSHCPLSLTASPVNLPLQDPDPHRLLQEASPDGPRQSSFFLYFFHLMSE